MAYVITLRVALAAVFGAASLAKLGDPRAFRAALPGYGLPRRLTAPIARTVPPLELLVAAALLVTPAARVAALAAAALLLLFSVAVAGALAMGRRPSCGCFVGGERVRLRTLARNGLLAVAALAVAMSDPQAALPGAFEAAAGAALVVVTLAVATYRALRRRGLELVRADALQEAAAAAADVPDRAPLGAIVGVGALVAAATARPLDDRQAVRSLLDAASPQLVGGAKRAGVRVRAQTPSGRRARRAAATALAAQRAQLLDVRTRLLGLQIQDPRADNARRLAAESLALFAASLSRVEAASAAAPKAATRRLSEARHFLEEAIYRGNRAALLLEP